MEAKLIRMILSSFLKTIMALALISVASYYFLKTDLGKIIIGL